MVQIQEFLNGIFTNALRDGKIFPTYFAHLLIIQEIVGEIHMNF